MKTKKIGNKGFSILESLVAVAILGVVSSSLIALPYLLLRTQKTTATKSSLEVVSSRVLSAIANQNSWDRTKNLNSDMSCARTFPSSCSAGWTAPIGLYDSDGKVLTSLQAQTGFRADGSVCQTYDVGTEGCLFQASVQWAVKCTSAESCQYPDEQVSVTFRYKGTEIINLNSFNVMMMSRKNLASNQSPTASCARRGRVFIGFGQVQRDHNSMLVESADGEGCVALDSFKGKQGPKGKQGNQGIAGPQGPAGIKGITLSPLTLAGGGGRGPSFCSDPSCYIALALLAESPGGAAAQVVDQSCAAQYGADFCFLEQKFKENPELLAEAIKQAKDGNTLKPDFWIAVEGKSPEEVARLLWLDSSGKPTADLGQYASSLRTAFTNAHDLGRSDYSAFLEYHSGMPYGVNPEDVTTGTRMVIDIVGAGAINSAREAYGLGAVQVATSTIANVNNVTAANVGAIANIAVRATSTGTVTDDMVAKYINDHGVAATEALLAEYGL